MTRRLCTLWVLMAHVPCRWWLCRSPLLRPGPRDGICQQPQLLSAWRWPTGSCRRAGRWPDPISLPAAAPVPTGSRQSDVHSGLLETGDFLTHLILSITVVTEPMWAPDYVSR